MPYVPIVDISADPGVVGAELDEICRTVGFFQITGHGIADDIAEPAWRLATAFLTSRWTTRTPTGPRGSPACRPAWDQARRPATSPCSPAPT
jgi:hypothetical protein